MNATQYFKNNKYLFLSLLISLCAFLLRIYDLDLRTMHHDETVNHYFLKQISELGYYPYSHENYHGPLYFYFTWPIFYFFGDSEFCLRFSCVFFGTGTVLLPLMLQKFLGWRWTLLSQAFIATSATIVYYNRYAIHESSFLFFTLLFAFALYRYLKSPQKKDLLWCGIALGALVSIKETYIITCFALFLSSLYLLQINRQFPKLSEIFKTLAISLFVIIIFYSGFLQWSKGLEEFALSVPQWLQRNDSDTGHFKPAGYYLGILWGTDLLHLIKIPYWRAVGLPLEAPTILVFLLTPFLITQLFKRRKETDFFGFCLIWALLITTIYSIPVKYKTPWLVLNITYPLYLLLAWQTVYLWKISKHYQLKILISLVIIVSLGSNIYSTWYYNFKYPSQEINPLAYVHTDPQILELTQEILTAAKQNPGSKILIAINTSWPFPYYLRTISTQVVYDSNAGDINNCDQLRTNYALVLLDHQKVFTCPNWEQKYFRVSGHQEAERYRRLP